MGERKETQKVKESIRRKEQMGTDEVKESLCR
jgi:hypothetical protein